jgi:xylulokinase
MLEAAAPDKPSGIVVLPHFAGAATPYMDTGSKGVILGLELSHTAADVFRAIMEGVCYEMMLNIERLAEAGIPVRSLNASGGCARSETWLQMKADIF